MFLGLQGRIWFIIVIIKFIYSGYERQNVTIISFASLLILHFPPYGIGICGSV
jgi:hypothetical protein